MGAPVSLKLRAALRHPANSITPLISALCWELGQPVPAGLKEPECHICDPHIPENTPSLHLKLEGSGVVFKRFGGDEAQGGAVELVARHLGLSEGDAAKWLLERAGLPIERVTSEKVAGKRQLPEGLRRYQQDRREAPALLSDAELEEGLQGWQPITAQTVCPEQQEIARRGLLPALESGLLRAYRRNDGAWQGKAIQRGAVAFEVTGPTGTAQTIKVRNPAATAKEGQKYAYLTSGKGTPAWCSPAFYAGTAPRSPQELWIEGEFSGMAAALALASVGQEKLRVQGVAGAGATPHLAHLQEGDEIFIYADPDAAGDKARKTWADLATAQHLRVRQLPSELFSEGDACDTLQKVGAHDMGQKMMEAVQASTTAAQDIWAGLPYKYTFSQGRLCKLTWQQDAQSQLATKEQPLTNFTAWIEKEVEKVDGSKESERYFHMAAQLPDLPHIIRFVVKASEFSSMNWVVEKLGGAAALLPGVRQKEEVRTAIQLLSKERGIQRVTCYAHTGWAQVGGEWLYLTAGAVIGKAGEVGEVVVELLGRLSNFALPAPESHALESDSEKAQEAVRASLALLELVPDTVGVVGLAAVYGAPLGRSKVSPWFQGPTGTNKTAYIGLLQAHYGKDWTREYLPESWHGSANALEQIAFLAKDALLVIDDFKPQGSNREQSEMHSKAARIIQGVADGQGRTTMTAERESRAAYYPRGTVISSAEELPRGHSNRARMFSVAIDQPLIGRTRERSADFYAAEDLAREGLYAQATAGYVQYLAAHYDKVRTGSEAHQTHIRTYGGLFKGDHGRTSQNPAELSYGWRVFLLYALSIRAITDEEAHALWRRVLAALDRVAREQDGLLRQVDPVRQAVTMISELLQQGSIYLHIKGELPDGVSPAALGWEQRPNGIWEHQSSARKLGWVEVTNGQLWANFIPDSLYKELRAFSMQQGGSLPGKAALWNAMRGRFDRQGLMQCSGERTSYRATDENGSRSWVISLAFPLQGSMYEQDDELADMPAELREATLQPLD